MYRDPRLPGASPYALLSDVQVAPASTLTEVSDAYFSLMELGRVRPEVRRAYDLLRIPASRLAVDFLYYPFSEAEVLEQLSNWNSFAPWQRPAGELIAALQTQAGSDAEEPGTALKGSAPARSLDITNLIEFDR